MDAFISMDDSTNPMDSDDTLTERGLDTSSDVPAIQIVETVAELEECDTTELSPIYDWINGMIADLFSSPPPAAAEAQLEFTYEGYRIHVQQNGTATFWRASA